MKIKEKKQVDALYTLKPSDKDIIPESTFAYEESRKELNKIKEIEKNVDRKKLIYKTFKHTCDFRKFKKIRTFGESIYNGKITLEEADESQSDLLGEIKNFNDKTRPQTFKKKQMKEDTLSTLNNFYDAREMVLNGFKSKVKAQVKAGNNSENLLNEIRQIIYSLYQSKEITKKVYNNLMKSL